MAKKNPYVTTIGFNKEDPDHVYVADFLNAMGRGKGQYIVKAIMVYQNPGVVASGHVVVPAVDYEEIKAFVLQVLEERGDVSKPSETKENLEMKQIKNQREEQDMHSKYAGLQDFDDVVANDIIASLKSFR